MRQSKSRVTTFQCRRSECGSGTATGTGTNAIHDPSAAQLMKSGCGWISQSNQL